MKRNRDDGVKSKFWIYKKENLQIRNGKIFLAA